MQNRINIQNNSNSNPLIPDELLMIAPQLKEILNHPEVQEVMNDPMLMRLLAGANDNLNSSHILPLTILFRPLKKALVKIGNEKLKNIIDDAITSVKIGVLSHPSVTDKQRKLASEFNIKPLLRNIDFVSIINDLETIIIKLSSSLPKSADFSVSLIKHPETAKLLKQYGLNEFVSGMFKLILEQMTLENETSSPNIANAIKAVSDQLQNFRNNPQIFIQSAFFAKTAIENPTDENLEELRAHAKAIQSTSKSSQYQKLAGALLSLAGVLAAYYLAPISIIYASVAGLGLFASGAGLIGHRIINDRKQKNLSQAEYKLASELQNRPNQKA